MRGPEKVEVAFPVDFAAAGVRLDRLLRKLLPDVPLSAIHRMIREGGARLGHEKLRASSRLAEGDTLTLSLARGDAEKLRARLAGKPEARPDARDLPILHEDEHVVAFDKPEGVATHPGSGHPLATTVLGALYAKAGRGDAVFTPALAGRLDRDASGVELAGKTPEGVRGLSALVREGGIAKAYLVLVSDDGLADEGRIDSPLFDTKWGRPRMMVLDSDGDDKSGDVPDASRGQVLEARTEYRVLSRGGGAALVEVRLETGRRHQIRAHMASVGVPVAGDVRYGDRAWNRALKRTSGLERLFLHCASAAFEHPVTGKTIRVASPLPRELAQALKALGITNPAPAKRRAGQSKRRERG